MAAVIVEFGSCNSKRHGFAPRGKSSVGKVEALLKTVGDPETLALFRDGWK